MVWLRGCTISFFFQYWFVCFFSIFLARLGALFCSLRVDLGRCLIGIEPLIRTASPNGDGALMATPRWTTPAPNGSGVDFHSPANPSPSTGPKIKETANVTSFSFYVSVAHVCTSAVTSVPSHIDFSYIASLSGNHWLRPLVDAKSWTNRL